MKNQIIPVENIQNRIFTIRGVQVMIDRDLAETYLVEIEVLNQSVKRNMDRFPTQFRFQLTNLEKLELVTNCDRFANLKHSSVNPYVFAEQGVAMLSAVLRSETADFMFELTEPDIDNMVSQVVIPFKIIREFVEIN